MRAADREREGEGEEVVGMVKKGFWEAERLEMKKGVGGVSGCCCWVFVFSKLF